jgi:hypothetical protein
MTSGCQARWPSPGLNCVLMSRLIPRSDHLSQGVLLPVWGGALRGGKCQFYTSDRATKAVTPVTFAPPVGEILFNAMSSDMATFHASISATTRPTPEKVPHIGSHLTSTMPQRTLSLHVQLAQFSRALQFRTLHAPLLLVYVLLEPWAKGFQRLVFLITRPGSPPAPIHFVGFFVFRAIPAKAASG